MKELLMAAVLVLAFATMGCLENRGMTATYGESDGISVGMLLPEEHERRLMEAWLRK
jgi:hypothetical protein